MTDLSNRGRDAYLAWQAEIGTEEVVLTVPWTRPAPRTIPRAAGAGPESPPGPRGVAPSPASGFTASSAGPEFFHSIAEKLAKAASVPAPSSSAAPKERGAVSSAASPLPEFRDAEAYWSWLADTWPVWFPGTAGPLVRAEGHPSPRLAVVGLSPSPEGLFAPEAGVLLDKMMKAIGLSREHMYLTSLMKTPPPGAGSRPGKTWARKDTARMVPALFRELRLAQCGLVLLLGESCAQIVLRTGRGIPDLLKAAEEAEGLSLSATWHPDEILGSGNDKALRNAAWEHLQWLRGLLPAGGS